MYRSEGLKPPRNYNQCTPFTISERQIQMLTLTGNGYTVPEIAKRMKIGTESVIAYRRRLNNFGYDKNSAPALTTETTLAVLLQDGINGCYMSHKIEHPSLVRLLPFEEQFIESIRNGEMVKEFKARTNTPVRKMDYTKKSVRRKLGTKNHNHTIARYSWLKNRGLVEIIEDYEEPPFPNLKPHQTELLRLLIRGLSTREIVSNLEISKFGVSKRRHSLKKIDERFIRRVLESYPFSEIDLTDKSDLSQISPTILINMLIVEGVSRGQLEYNIGNQQIARITKGEEDLINAVAIDNVIIDGKKSNTAIQFGLPIDSLKKKLNVKTRYELLAKYTALKKEDLLVIE